MLSLFYRSPRLLILTMALILVSGLSSLHVMPRLEDPILVNRVAQVTTVLPGAGAERVEALVTERLEEAVREIEEVRRVDSRSRAELSYLVIELNEDVTAVDEVWSRVRNKIDDATASLPVESQPPEFETPDFKAYSLLVALRWQAESPVDYGILRRNAEVLEDVLRAVPGTEKTELYGAPDEEIVVEVDADQMAQLGLTTSAIAARLRASDAKVTAGQYRGNRDTLLLEVDSQLDSVARVARTPIQTASDGRVTALGDVALVRKGVTDPPSELAIIGGRGAIVVGAMVRADDRIDRWTGQALAAVDDYAAGLSRGMTVQPVFVQNHYVSSRLLGLLGNLVFGALAVMLVMVLMMGWRSAIIVSAALPLTTLLVLSGLRLMGIPIQQMSVTGLVIALGLLIDNAIVVVDDVRENLRGGCERAAAVRASVRRLGVPLFGSTLTTALAFMPLALLPGGTGEFVAAIGISVMLAIFSSLVLSLTVIPALTARFEGRAAASAGTGFWRHGLSNAWLAARYRRSLDTIFARPWLGMLVGIAVPALGFLCFGAVDRTVLSAQRPGPMPCPVKASGAHVPE